VSVAASRIALPVGVVIIGRNEGERLMRCIGSVRNLGLAVVYVDSASTDGSPERAERAGVDVIQLDLARPFTAGRARNEGYARLLALQPQLEYVQFVDGDCEVREGWIETAVAELQRDARVVSVCGRRQERFPEASIYNLLCDIEWDTPIGDTDATGGDFMIRAAAFEDVGGFNPGLIAGEEPELGHRLRSRGWIIRRLDAPMTWHDAAMFRLSQWARRSSRSGYAYAARAALHLGDGSRYGWRENLRIAFWALAVPVVIVALAVVASPVWLALLAIYPIQLLRGWVGARRAGLGSAALPQAVFLLLGKWTECWGQLRFLARRLTGAEQRIIEYK
jgi:glycosyltransferase involved in cell wall biosynthesis